MISQQLIIQCDVCSVCLHIKHIKSRTKSDMEKL